MMKLEKLLKDLPIPQIVGSKDILITGIASNSKLVRPGHLFIAKKGKMHDGAQYIKEAVCSGAAAIAAESYDPAHPFVTQVIYKEIASIESALAANFYRHPSHELFMVGITGTNGKTTTSFIVKSLLDASLGPCGLIGTIENIIGNQSSPATLTTPDVLTNHKMLREMAAAGCRSCVMEVTSHALDQGRSDKIDFDIALFTNLTAEHLDYHGCMETYADAKKKLFDNIGKEASLKKGGKRVIVNQDCPWTPHMLKNCSVPIITYGIDSPADLMASSICFERGETKGIISYLGQSIECRWPLIGRFNVYNCLAAIAVLLSQNIPLNLIASCLPKIPSIRGRLQPVENDLGIEIYVDFAHKTDALINVLKTLKEAKRGGGRLIAVFGCAGDRDRLKRPKMAQACELYADYSIVTSDNPRSEDPLSICDEVAAGFSKNKAYRIEVNRKAAIYAAIESARPGDIVLIAGKGHETTQVSAFETIDFDDCAIAAKTCEELIRIKGNACLA